MVLPSCRWRPIELCHVRARCGRELLGRHQLLHRAADAPGHVPHVAELRLRLLQRRQRLAVERIGREVRPAVVGDLHHRQPVDLRHEVGVDLQRRREIESRAAAHDRCVAELVGEAEARLEVVGVVRPAGVDERRHRVLVAAAVDVQVVAQAKVERQVRARTASRPAATRHTGDARRGWRNRRRRCCRCAPTARSPPGSRCRRSMDRGTTPGAARTRDRLAVGHACASMLPMHAWQLLPSSIMMTASNLP